MNYALIVEWADTDTFSSFFFDTLERAEKERDRERNNGNIANIYKEIEE